MVGASAVAQALPSTSNRAGQGFGAWTLATGIVYGLQPDALFVIVPALALPTRLAAAAYMGMFVAGTVAAMGSYAAFIGEIHGCQPVQLQLCDNCCACILQ